MLDMLRSTYSHVQCVRQLGVVNVTKLLGIKKPSCRNASASADCVDFTGN